jgi:uncharacterized membrane protein
MTTNLFLRRVAAILACAWAATAAAAPRYQLVDLGWQNWPAQINGRGAIAGQYQQAVAGRYVNGRWRQLDTGGMYADSAGNAINYRGDVAGVGDSYDPVRWPAGGAMQVLQLPGQYGAARGIAGDGTVVGSFLGADGVDHCAEWPGPYTAIVQLDLGADGIACEMVAINRRAQMAGQKATETGPRAPLHAFLYQDGRFHLLGHVEGHAQTIAAGLNVHGHIVGSAQDPRGRNPATAYLYDGQQLVPLGQLAPGHGFEATAINDQDQIVGWGSNEQDQDKAAIYDGGQWIALESLTDGLGTWTLERAFSINDDGIIVGMGTGPDGLWHGYELVPETR